MRYYPDDEQEYKEELKAYAAEPWMIDQLKRNWSYINWGPHEDYQWNTKSYHPNSSRVIPTWPAFRETFKAGHHPEATEDRSGGEIVGWYFNLARRHTQCLRCDGGGYNAETRKISNSYYDWDGTGDRWDSNITQDEADALVARGRLMDLVHVRSEAALMKLVAEDKLTGLQAAGLWEHRETKYDRYDEDTGELVGVFIKWRDSVPAAEVNEWNGSAAFGGHDAINRGILVETRAKRLGVWGLCETCDGHGQVPVESHGRLQLVLWIVNPATGQNYGLEIDKLEQQDLPEIYEFLIEMRDRLVSRLDLPETHTLSQLREFNSDEPTGWTNADSVLASRDGWGAPLEFNSWEEFRWPVSYKYGERSRDYRVPEEHSKFRELRKTDPSWGLDDLNELIGVQFELTEASIDGLSLWMAHPRKGCSRKVFIKRITPTDLPEIRGYILEGRDRAKARLDPACETTKESSC